MPVCVTTVFALEDIAAEAELLYPYSPDIDFEADGS